MLKFLLRMGLMSWAFKKLAAAAAASRKSAPGRPR